MRINNNLMAMNTHRQLGIGTNNGAKSMEKLSSGFRINRAGDDAAGLAISEKMRGQIRGLNQASRNSQDGISLIQTAEGALNETQAILQRMRELSVQSANGTATDSDRKEIQKEVSQLQSEIDRIATTTEFNTKKLINGDVAINAKSTANFANTKLTDVKVVNDEMKATTYTVTTSVVSDVFTEIADTTDVSAIALGTGKTADLGTYTLKAVENSGDNTKLDYTLFDSNGQELAIATVLKTATTASVGAFDFTVTDTSGGTTGEGELKFTVGQTATFQVLDGTNSIETKTVTNNITGTVQVGGLELSFNTDLAAASDADVKVTNNALQFQIGANENQTMKLGIGDMSAKALKVASVDVSTQTGAEAAITAVNNAIERVSSERSKLGAVQNRLEHSIKNLDTSSENLQAAESRIRDVDMAKEMMELTKNNILQQAAQAMLAQANQQPQGVLQLLR
ncbi:flagellin [Acetoanaerobium noterae]|uniref:flagellin N-terminal helical domain-containing protein n=1 Tax=Acetoanaerobium noterae TaxID=745369 RepID=UPI003221663B